MPTPAIAYDLDLDLTRDLAYAHARALALDLTHARARGRALVHALDRVREDVFVFIGDLERSLAAAENNAAAWRPAGRFSTRITEWATQLLPRADRSHYRELYRSELTELAQGIHPHRAQLAYTLRVMLRLLLLRHILRAPAPAARQRIW